MKKDNAKQEVYLEIDYRRLTALVAFASAVGALVASAGTVEIHNAIASHNSFGKGKPASVFYSHLDRDPNATVSMAPGRLKSKFEDSMSGGIVLAPQPEQKSRLGTKNYRRG